MAAKHIVKSLIARDGNICKICGIEFLDSTDGYPQDLHITADHIIPRIQNGADDISNLQLAHHVCNELRSDSDITPLLMDLCRHTIKVQMLRKQYFTEMNARRKAVAHANILIATALKGLAHLESIEWAEQEISVALAGLQKLEAMFNSSISSKD